MEVKICAKIEDLKTQRADHCKEIAVTEIQLSHCISTSRMLQAEIERDLSTIYGGRPVNLVGDINAI